MGWILEARPDVVTQRRAGAEKSWMAGTSPAMTAGGECRYTGVGAASMRRITRSESALRRFVSGAVWATIDSLYLIIYSFVVAGLVPAIHGGAVLVVCGIGAGIAGPPEQVRG